MYLYIAEATLIIARTDAIAVEGFAAAIDRAETYREAGADVLFTPTLPTNETLTTVGGAARLELSIVYFTSHKFNLRAGADVIMLFGSRSVEGVDGSTGIFQTDVGWNVGFGYIF